MDTNVREKFSCDTPRILGWDGTSVDSVLTQLARKLTKMTLIGTASQPESNRWVLNAGAHHTIDHTLPLSEELAGIGIKNITHVASINHTEDHYVEIIRALAPRETGID